MKKDMHAEKRLKYKSGKAVAKCHVKSSRYRRRKKGKK